MRASLNKNVKSYLFSFDMDSRISPKEKYYVFYVFLDELQQFFVNVVICARKDGISGPLNQVVRTNINISES